MKKKINIQFLIITLLAILTTVSLSIFVFYELFKQEVMADLKTNTQLLVETDAWEQIAKSKSGNWLFNLFQCAASVFIPSSFAISAPAPNRKCISDKS